MELFFTFSIKFCVLKMTICFEVAFCVRSCKIKTKYPREGEERILYNLIIVEDRDELRHSLRNYIQWEQLGFSVCGDFADGRRRWIFCCPTRRMLRCAMCACP